MESLSEGFAARFWAKVSVTPNCWEWSAALDADGYGRVSAGSRGAGMLQAHRASWCLTFGDVPEGQSVLHRCDNRRCVRPGHLFLGTQRENAQDMAQKERGNTRKLTASEVIQIRFASSRGESRSALARRYGVGRSNIGSIARRETWQHVVPDDLDGYEPRDPKRFDLDRFDG